MNTEHIIDVADPGEQTGWRDEEVLPNYYLTERTDRVYGFIDQLWAQIESDSEWIEEHVIDVFDPPGAQSWSEEHVSNVADPGEQIGWRDEEVTTNFYLIERTGREYGFVDRHWLIERKGKRGLIENYWLIERFEEGSAGYVAVEGRIGYADPGPGYEPPAAGWRIH